jgi:hypothetical protein
MNLFEELIEFNHYEINLFDIDLKIYNYFISIVSQDLLSLLQDFNEIFNSNDF